MTGSPTLVEFQATVRDAFGYIVRDFAFRDTEHRLERERLAAVADATVALRTKDFPRVVELLMPYSEHLTAAERAKLDYARARSR